MARSSSIRSISYVIALTFCASPLVAISPIAAADAPGGTAIFLSPGSIPVGDASIVSVNVTTDGAPAVGAVVALCGPPIGGGCTDDATTDSEGTATIGLTPSSPGLLNVHLDGNPTDVNLTVTSGGGGGGCGDHCGGGGPPQCFGGDANVGFTIHFPGATGSPASGVLRGVATGPGGCVSTAGFNGLFGQDFHGGMGGLQPGQYNVTVWLDTNLDGVVDPSERHDDRTGLTFGSVQSSLEFSFPDFDAFDPANVPSGPCFGFGHFNGTVATTSGANATVMLQPNAGGCRFGNGLGRATQHEFENGTGWEFWGVNDSMDPWTITAFLDANDNGQLDGGETVANETATNGSFTPIVLPGDGLAFQPGGGGGCGDHCGGGGGGCGPDGCPPGPGGGGFGGCSASPGGTVHGTVHSPFGGIKAFANLNFQNDATGMGVASNNSDENGTYSCTIAPGTYLLNACCDGQAFIVFTIAENESLLVDVNLSYNAHPPYHFPTTFYGGTLWGNASIVNGSDATPAEGVRVSVYPSYSGAPCSEDYSTEGRPLRCYGEGVVQANGTFVITGLQASTFHLDADGSSVDLAHLHFENYVTFENVTAETEDAVDVGAINFSAPSYIQGTVRSDGDPVSGVQVSAQPQCFGPSPGPGSCGSSGQDTTGPDGTYRIAVSAGTYRLEARTDPYTYAGPPLTSATVECFQGPGSHCIELATGETNVTDFDLQQGIVIHGHVQDSEGNPVQANVNVQEHHEGPCCFGPSQNYWGQTMWNDPGNYSITVDPGTYDVRFEPYSWARPDLASRTFTSVNVTSSYQLDVELASGGVIEGYVNDSAGAPAPYANIVANTHANRGPGDCCSMGQFAGYASTDATGHFRLSGLSDATDGFDLNVQPGYGSDLQQKTVPSVHATPGETTHLDIVLLSGGKIAGYVYGPDGSPVRNAFVNAWWQIDFNPTTPPPPPSSGGHGGGSGGGGPGDNLTACDDTAPANVPLSGSWTHDGPLDATDLTFVALANGDQQMGTFDAEAHTFSFSGLKACQYVLAAFKNVPSPGSDGPKPDANGTLGFYPGAASDHPTFLDTLDLSAPLDPITIELRDAPDGGWPILQDDGGHGGGGGSGGSGGFFGGGGSPPPTSEPQSCSTGCWGSSQTDANGHYEIRGLGNGSFGMYVSPPFDRPELSSASMDAFRDTLPVVTLGNTTQLDFTLASAGIVEGCLKTSGGDPVAFAWISMWSTTGGGGGASSGGDGCFTVFGMRAGAYELDVQPPWFGDQSGLARKHVSNVAVVEGARTNLHDITMSDGITFSGRVVLASDATHGVSGASVNVWPIQDQPGSFGGGGGFAWTDADGNFTVRGLTEGRFGVNVWPQYGTGLTSYYNETVLPDEIGTHVIALGSAGWINGTVVRAAGHAPVVGAYVGAWSPHGGYAGGVTDDNGDFNLTNLGPANDYSLDVWPPYTSTDLAGDHLSGITVVSDGPADLFGTGNNTLELARGGALVGHVQDANGDPVASASVNVGGRTTFGWGMTDTNGNFTVPGLSPSANESLHVFVQPSFGMALVGKEARVRWAPDDAGVTDAGTISLDAGKTLVGTITRSGSPVAAWVYAWPSSDPHGHPSGPSGGYALTDSNGNYSIAGVVQGQAYDVSVYPTDGSAGNFTDHAITIGSGDTTTYDVSLGGSGDLSVHVSDGANVEGATVDCFNSELHAGRTGTTDANGAVTLSGLPVGDYDCHVTAAGHTPNGGAGNVPANSSTPVEIVLTAATLNTVTGTYSTGNDTSPSGFYVIAAPHAGSGDRTTTAFNVTNETGGFTLSGLVDDDYDVKVIDATGAVIAEMTAHIESNAATPILDLTFGDTLGA